MVIGSPYPHIGMDDKIPADEHLLKMVQERALIAYEMDELVSQRLFHELLEFSASGFGSG